MESQFFNIVQTVLLQEIKCSIKSDIIFTAANKLDLEILTICSNEKYFDDFIERVDIYTYTNDPESVEHPIEYIQGHYNDVIVKMYDELQIEQEPTVEQEAAEDLRHNTLSSIS